MPVTYEDIKKANDEVGLSTIKRESKNGKVTTFEYATVAQRIKAFRMVYPDGCILTDMVSNENGVCVFRASVYSCGDITINSLLATGTAYEREGSSFINNSSYIENCETSAVGRALGIAGFGIDQDVATADEILNAQQNQIANEKPTEAHIKALEKRCADDGVDVAALCKLYKVKTLGDLTMKKYVNIHENWDKISLMGKENK